MFAKSSTRDGSVECQIYPDLGYLVNKFHQQLLTIKAVAVCWPQVSVELCVD